MSARTARDIRMAYGTSSYLRRRPYSPSQTPTTPWWAARKIKIGESIARR